MGIVNAEAALTYIATVIILTFIFGPAGLFTGDILLNLFGGGLILGACYMLTDYAFASRRGRDVYKRQPHSLPKQPRIPEGILREQKAFLPVRHLL